jgi:hypothetical protein
MNEYWIMIKTPSGGIQRVTIIADNTFFATQQAKALYGNQLITENANWVRSLK